MNYEEFLAVISKYGYTKTREAFELLSRGYTYEEVLSELDIL